VLRGTVGAGAEVACHLCESVVERLGSVPYSGDHIGGDVGSQRSGSKGIRKSEWCFDIINNVIATVAVAITASPRHQRQHRSDITSLSWGPNKLSLFVDPVTCRRDLNVLSKYNQYKITKCQNSMSPNEYNTEIDIGN
jgi:hypothetical protein